MFTALKTSQSKSTFKPQSLVPDRDVLERVKVRLITPDERERFDELIRTRHYLRSATLVGEQLRYVAECDGRWLALLCWCAAARHLRSRDHWIGWSDEQRRCRLALIANNSRFLILAERGELPNIASRVMRLCLARLSDDWLVRYEHPVALVESFVDTQLFRGTAYKASGWVALDHTLGYARNSQDFYTRHARPKQPWVRELVPGARHKLCAPVLPQAWASVEAKVAPRCTFHIDELHSLREHFMGLPDMRSKKSLRYPMSGLLTLITCATLSGVARGQRDLAAYGRTLSQHQLRALGFRPSRKAGGKLTAPSEITLFNILCAADADLVQRAVLCWQEQVLGPLPADELIAIDGKTLRSARGLEIVNAHAPRSGRWLGSEMVAEGSNEIAAARALIDKLELSGRLVCLDALHTQKATAAQIVQEAGGDYLLSVKGNQGSLQKTLEDQVTAAATLAAHSPTGHHAGR
jgi:hypothetical protein